jgi:hypothetical protein
MAMSARAKGKMGTQLKIHLKNYFIYVTIFKHYIYFILLISWQILMISSLTEASLNLTAEANGVS